MQRRHPLSFAVKRQCTQTWQGLLQHRLVVTGGPRRLEQGQLGRLPGRPAIVGNHVIAERHRPGGLRQSDAAAIRWQPVMTPTLGKAALDRHLVKRQRAGLVGADVGHRAQRLDCGKVAHQCLVSDQPARTEGK